MTKSNFNKQVYDSFIEAHKPIQNHLSNDRAFNGAMFETFGAESEFVKSQPKNKICTVVDGGGRDLLILGGYCLNNRLGYLVLENPLSDEQMNNLEIYC